VKIVFLVAAIYLTYFPAKGQALSADSIITIQSIANSVSALAHDSMGGRGNGSREILLAATYIATRFKEAGLSPVAGVDGYFFPYTFKTLYGRLNEVNVIAALKGKISPDTMVIFSAHYDHLGRFSYNNNTDNIYNGANDNASGVATLFELAKYYKAKNDNRYTILFAAFSGEELGLWGSKQFASELKRKLVHAVINFDMLGRPMPEKPDKAMVVGNNSSRIIKKLNKQLGPERSFFIRDQYLSQQLLIRSDHASFSHFKTSFSIMCTSPYDRYYHTVDDEIYTIDYAFLRQTIVNIARACEVYTGSVLLSNVKEKK
jgi:Zn-dependent M28 family amino/carboxypeptidase